MWTSFNVSAEPKENLNDLKKLEVKGLIGKEAPKYTMPGKRHQWSDSDKYGATLYMFKSEV